MTEKKQGELLITARVRSMTGRSCFDTRLSINLSVHRGGSSRLSRGGEGGQSSRGGGSADRGVGQPGGGQPGGGQSAGRGGVSQLAGGGSAKIGQQNDSLHGGRYASCVHAGGLSCI